MEKALFAAGCFWGVEAGFRELPGVIEVTSGYAGGEKPEPTYEQVCGGATGHAETVEVTFDPEQVSYERLLDRFWELHDPTQVNRQGPDVGTQYRSAIFYASKEQRQAAVASRERAQERFERPIATQITPASEFWRAEDYHQRYYEKQGALGRLLRR